jgi:hypothetical protein
MPAQSRIALRLPPPNGAKMLGQHHGNHARLDLGVRAGQAPEHLMQQEQDKNNAP